MSEGRNARPKTVKARTVANREAQLIDLAVEMAERQLRQGTAPTQVVAHYLKLGSTREALEQERLASENELLRAKVLDLERQAEERIGYQQVIDALKLYSGQNDSEDYS